MGRLRVGSPTMALRGCLAATWSRDSWVSGCFASTGFGRFTLPGTYAQQTTPISRAGGRGVGR